MKAILVATLLVCARVASAQTCSMHAPAPEPAGRPMKLDGLGNHHHAITATRQAQGWFDQGLRLVYAFNHDEAIRSFQEGARVDPDCAMCHWGVALALGPNINLPIDSEHATQAADEIAEAQALAPKVSADEREYIAALARRYGPTAAGGDRTALDRAYADAMRSLARKHPGDVDAQVLFAESMMDLRPWDLWTHEGAPQPGTEELVAALERALKLDANNPGANHFFIHAVEGSPHPERGLEAAARLPKLMPGAGHVVHMPAHIYMRVGRYADATRANEQAIAADKAYLAKTHADGVYAAMYVAHNFQFLWASAAMEGRSAQSVGAAHEMVSRVPPEMVRAMSKEMPAMDYLLSPPFFAMVRFGQWDALLAEPAPPQDFAYQTAMWHFARALALGAKGKLDEARKEQATFDAFVAKIPKDVAVGPSNTVAAVFGVAQALLSGELARHAGDHAKALEQLALAVQREDALGYDEPPAWPLPARHFLGAEQLEQGKLSDAMATYRQDLQRNPENGYALFGLIQASKKGDAKELAALEARFKKAWARSDVKLASSRF